MPMIEGNLGIQNPGSVPAYARNMFGANTFNTGVSNIGTGIMDLINNPYKNAEGPLKQYTGQAIETQNPFYRAGTSAIPDYQHWLGQMQNPSGFINNLMNNYQESPFAKYQQQQGIRAAQNLGSASGLTGSTALQQQAEQNAQNISSGDMNQWLQNVLGINTQYGAGEKGLIDTGQTAAANISNLQNNEGENLANLGYNEASTENSGWGSLLNGALTLATL